VRLRHTRAGPVIYEDLKLSRLGVDDQRTRVGDLMLSPVLLSWHKQRFDLVI